jgi:hypothetical protein
MIHELCCNPIRFAMLATSSSTFLVLLFMYGAAEGQFTIQQLQQLVTTA